jgi:rRNA maturation protein Nop10
MSKHETQLNYTRKRECMMCGHEWVAPVVLSDYTTNLSGEARVWCPECSSISVVSHPAEKVEHND